MKLEVGSETGTLQELNVKPGDVVEWLDCPWYGEMIVESIKAVTKGKYAGDVDATLSEYGGGIFGPEHFRIISRASTTTSPVRTVTKREIVPGVYGKVEVVKVDNNDGSPWIKVDAYMSHTSLTAAIETLTAIKEAME